MRGPARPNRRVLVGSFLLLSGVFALTNTGRFHVIDEYETFFMVQSLLERGAVDMPQVRGSEYFFGRVGQDGRLYSPYGIGQPILTVPFLALGEWISQFLPRPTVDADFWLWFASTLSNAVYSALAVVLIQAWLFRRGLSSTRVLWAGLLIGLGTLVWVYAGQYRSGTSLMMVFAGMLFGAEIRDRRADVLLFTLALLAMLLRVDALLGVALFAVYRASLPDFATGMRGLVRAAAPLLIGVGLGVATTLYLNFAHFGNPFQTAYPDQDDIGRPANQLGFPSWVAIAVLLFSPGKGLLVFCPVITLSFLRLPVFFARHTREGALVVGLAGSYLLFYSSWQHYEGGWCFGPRFLLPVTPFLVLPIVFFPLRATVLAPLAIFGAGISLLGLSVNFLGVAQAEGYYLHLTDAMQKLTYNIWHSPLPAHIAALFDCVKDLWSGVEFEKKPGHGLNFWWAFAAKEGISGMTILSIAGTWVALIVLGLVLLRSQSPQNDREEENGAREEDEVNVVDQGVVTR